jgi:hypothetical protein
MMGTRCLRPYTLVPNDRRRNLCSGFAPRRYTAELENALRGASSLRYGGLGWDCDAAEHACKALLYAHFAGCLDSARVLWLDDNTIGWNGVGSLAEMFKQGALADLEALHLSGNPLSNAGAATLAASLAGGMLPRLSELSLAGCQIGDSGVAKLADAFEGGATPGLRSLYLYSNPIVNAATTLASALCSGAPSAH